jgi:ABC-type Fe3+/spermidine/putrescine transport system ATPase subunit
VATRDDLRATLRRAGVAAVFVTHDQEDAFAVADRVALLRGGRLLQVGAPEALYDRPASRAVAEFVGRAALVPASRDGDDALVTLGGVVQRTSAAAAPEVGRGGLAVLRPEALALAAVDAPGVWTGVVAARRFAGSAVVCRIALDGAVVEVATADRGVRDGDRVGVRLTGTVVALVPAAPGTDESA